MPRAYVYLLGLYLGDGCISPAPRGVFKLRIVLDAKYPGIIDEAQCAIGKVMPLNKVTVQVRPKNCVEVYAYSKAWPCLLPQHGPGRKHRRRIALEVWQARLAERWPEALIRGLIHSDGCRFINTGRGWRHPRYSFCNQGDLLWRLRSARLAVDTSRPEDDLRVEQSRRSRARPHRRAQVLERRATGRRSGASRRAPRRRSAESAA